MLLAKTSRKTALFDNELTVFQNVQVSDSPTDMDKWLALVVGNLLHDDVPENRDFFNGRLEFPKHLFEMIKGWNYCDGDASPNWTRNYFKGIILTNDRDYDLSQMNFSSLNFSYSILKKLLMSHSNFQHTNFDNSILKNVQITGSRLIDSSFENIEIEVLHIGHSLLSYNVLIPIQLANIFFDRRGSYINLGISKTYISNEENELYYKDIFDTLKGLLIYGLKNNLFDILEIKSWFDYGSDEDRKEFESLIDGLKDE